MSSAAPSTRVGTIRVGISGWRYAGWRGDFYPAGLPQRRELEYVAERMDSVEINGSFYSLQRPESYERWRDAVPDEFVFAVKGGRYLTHMLRLRGIETALANFFASGVLALGHKLGPVLWQLPERFAFDPTVLAGFFAALPRSTTAALELGRNHDARLTGRTWLGEVEDRPLRYALEVRHASFASPEFPALSAAHGISIVVADTAGRWPLLTDITSDHVYVRLHGAEKLYTSGYTDVQLSQWADCIEGWATGAAAPDGAARDVYVYFDNDAKARAPYDAMRLRELLKARIRRGMGRSLNL